MRNERNTTGTQDSTGRRNTSIGRCGSARFQQDADRAIGVETGKRLPSQPTRLSLNAPPSLAMNRRGFSSEEVKHRQVELG